MSLIDITHHFDRRNLPASPPKTRSVPSTPKGDTLTTTTTSASSAANVATVPEEEARNPVAAISAIATQCMLVSVNYITTLLETESLGKLQQSIHIKRRLYDMYNNLPLRDQDKLAQGVVPAVAGMPVFAYVNVAANLTKVVDEMEQYLETRAKRAAAEAEEELRRRLEEEASVMESSVPEGSVKSLDPRALRREKKAKYAAQRKLDAAKRVEVTKQRQALYEMIQTDRITTIFNARAHGAESSDAPGWGEQNEHEMAQLSDEMNELTAALVGGAHANGSDTHSVAPVTALVAPASP